MQAKDHGESFIALINAIQPDVTEISVQELAEKIENGDKFVLIDVREDCEWEIGRLYDAIHLSKGMIESEIEEAVADKSQDIVLYCRGGFRALIAANLLQKMGYTNVKSLSGGLFAWVDADFEHAGEFMDAAMQKDYYAHQAPGGIENKPWEEN
jgi:rhodanese-related sulfurtransferase